MKNRIFIVALGLLSSVAAYAQNTLYDLGTVQNIEIFFSQADWNHQLHVLKLTTDGYLKADSVRINGTRFANVGVKYKGNSSYDSTWVKNPWTIALDKYEDHSYEGYTSLKLSNCYQDPSLIREVLSYNILSNYMECSQANFARVYVNGHYFGLYTNVEDIGKTWCASHFKSSKSNAFFKGNPLITPGPAVKSNLKYLGADSSLYANYYEIKSTYGWNRLVALCDAASNNGSVLPSLLDMDRFTWMMAFNNLLVNLDSYIGAFAQNYYIFRDNNGIFNPIVWDLNMSLGGFPFVGSSNTSLGSLSIANMKQLPTTIHQTDPYWPVINVVMANARLKKKYHAHLRTMLQEYVATGIYDTLAGQMQATIAGAVEADTHKFFSTAQFQQSLNTDIDAGTYQVPGIRNLMEARKTYLLGRPEITATSPSISNVSASFDGTNAWVTATLTNHQDTAVFLGYRNSAAAKFTRIKMYDDGLHADQAAGDGVFGTSFEANATQSQFYLYAENAEAAIFSPLRAEHEFYSLSNYTSTKNAVAAGLAFSFYPNPTSGHLVVETGVNTPQNLLIFNSLGQKLAEMNVTHGQQIQLPKGNGMVFLKMGRQVKKCLVMQ